ncbi:Acetyltransferase (GNAT) domain-containing protein [Alkalibacterium subtropicum]|uniref:Acetyltransferase (GNAT) domain-containing protein n=1 Tax=Alkalibacterium subtropicum TaxID=753702 RepID=A0A1I1K8S0_9LACT|nr:GNAT family N-acetyltransferase [Alkalibacterium subtropicum]SFC56955.1 Acetyltransferase (GNAT) domain-containing protein [Alkalibacterium subtropicum]
MEISVVNGHRIQSKTLNNPLNYKDIYSSYTYAQLYEEIENGEAVSYTFENEYGIVDYTFIKRKIPFLVEGKQFYDITTAYGYGGLEISNVTDSEALLDTYFKAFHDYCQTNDIVSEFIRFHLFENEEIKKYFYGEIGLIGSHISRNLNDPIDCNFHNTISRAARKAERLGLHVSFDTSGESVDDFLNVYTETMDRNNAKDFYYFDKKFFEKLHHHLKDQFIYANAVYEDKTVSSILVLFGEKYAYFFLGGTLQEYLSTDASTFLQYNVIQYLKEKGLDYYTLGGGYKGNDGLYRYKKKFDKQGVYPFHVGKKVHDLDVYNKLVEMSASKGDIDTESSFFPLYRM